LHAPRIPPALISFCIAINSAGGADLLLSELNTLRQPAALVAIAPATNALKGLIDQAILLRTP
jgi:hypothetical protein